MAITGADTSSSPPVQCPQCSRVLPCLDMEQSSYFGCEHCRTFFRSEWEEKEVILQRFGMMVKATPRLPLGATLRLDQQVYTVAAWMLKQEAKEDEEEETFEWQEYILWRPAAPPLVLVDLKDHYLLVRPAAGAPELRNVYGVSSLAVYHGLTYTLERSYQFVLLKATGEFDENILEHHLSMVVYEYELGRRALIRELMPASDHWYASERMSVQQVMEAAESGGSGVEEQFTQLYARTESRAAASAHWRLLRPLMLKAMAVLLLVQVLLSILRPPQQLAEQRFSTSDAGPAMPEGRVAVPSGWGAPEATGNHKPVMSASFNISGPTGIEITFDTDVSNSWIDFDGTLVAEGPGKSIDFEKSAAYYSGMEDGESWSEGSQSCTVKLSGVPAGRYHLNIVPATENNNPATYTVTVTQHTWWASNFFLVLLVIAGYPLLYLIIQSQRYKK